MESVRSSWKPELKSSSPPAPPHRKKRRVKGSHRKRRSGPSLAAKAGLRGRSLPFAAKIVTIPVVMTFLDTIFIRSLGHNLQAFHNVCSLIANPYIYTYMCVCVVHQGQLPLHGRLRAMRPPGLGRRQGPDASQGFFVRRLRNCLDSPV